MALAWQPVDVRTDPHEPEYHGDPADVFEALSELLGRPAWHSRAACRGKGPDLFYPGQGVDLTPAREICADCMVKVDCLAAALEVSTAVDFGVWAGTSVQARKQLRRAIKVNAA